MQASDQAAEVNEKPRQNEQDENHSQPDATYTMLGMPAPMPGWIAGDSHLVYVQERHFAAVDGALDQVLEIPIESDSLVHFDSAPDVASVAQVPCPLGDLCVVREEVFRLNLAARRAEK